MIRRLLCADCGSDVSPGPDELGWETRIVRGLSRLPNLVCDVCSASLQEGSTAIAVSYWRYDPPIDWEGDYLTVQSCE